MSHVVKFKIGIYDLDILEATCKRMGLELVRGVKTFVTYQRDQTCNHIIKRVDADAGDYQIGVVNPTEENGAYELLFDPWEGGTGVTKMLDIVGSDRSGSLLGTLAQEYVHQAAVETAEMYGGTVVQTEEGGNIVYTIDLPEEVVHA